MNNPQLLDAMRRLLGDHLDRCRQQVAEYLAKNGDTATPHTVAAACPATFGDLTIAAWALEQNGHEQHHLRRAA